MHGRVIFSHMTRFVVHGSFSCNFACAERAERNKSSMEKRTYIVVALGACSLNETVSKVSKNTNLIKAITVS